MPEIHLRQWDPPAGVEPRRLGIYILHGLSEHSGRYQRLAQWLASQGWRVASHDHPGHGRSGGVPGRMTPPGSFATAAAIQIGRFATLMQAPPILIGHSLGGALAAELVLIHKQPVQALVLSSPGIAPLMNCRQRWQLSVMSRLAPDLTIQRPIAGWRLSHDDEVVQAYRDDPLVHGFVSARLIQWLVDTGERAVTAAPELAVPTLLMIAGDDLIVDASAAEKLAANMPASLVTMKRYDGYFHEVFNEEAQRRIAVLNDLSQWLNQISPVTT